MRELFLIAGALLTLLPVAPASAQSGSDWCVCYAYAGRFMGPDPDRVGVEGYEFSYVSRPFQEDRLTCVGKEAARYAAFVKKMGIRVRDAECNRHKSEDQAYAYVESELTIRYSEWYYGTFYNGELVEYR